MYSEQDIAAVSKRQKRYRNLLIGMGFCFIGGAALFWFFRLLVPVIAWTLLAVGGMIFFFDHYYAAERLYGKFLRRICAGNTRDISGRFLSEEITVRDGLVFRRWVLDTEDGEIIAYYDMRKKRERPEEGARIRATVCENYVFKEYGE